MSDLERALEQSDDAFTSAAYSERYGNVEELAAYATLAVASELRAIRLLLTEGKAQG